jgi:hypothetical protein
MAVNSAEIRKVPGLSAAPDLSTFSATVHIISGASYKLFLRLGIGDGAFARSAKMRQKAPFWRCDLRRSTLGDNATNEPTIDGVGNRKRDERTHRRLRRK